MRLGVVGMAVVAGLCLAPRSSPPTASAAPAAIFLQGLAKGGPETGEAVTGIQIQNLDPADTATVVVDFYPDAGGPPVSVRPPPFPPRSAYNVYLPQVPGLAAGWYAAVVSGDRRLAAIARTEWTGSGKVALFSSSPAAEDLVLPLVARHYAGQTAVVRVQNVNVREPIQVTVDFIAAGATVPSLSRRYPIPAAGFATLDLGDPSLAALPDGFLGYLRLRSPGQPVAAMAYVDFGSSEKALYGFEAVPATQAAGRLFVPLFRNEYYGTTGISVVNPGPTGSEVTVRFVGNTRACQGLRVAQGPVHLDAGGSAVFYQGQVDVPGTGTSPLPRGCAGSATVEAAGGRLLAVVNDAGGSPAHPTRSAAYIAGGQLQDARELALPLYRKQHTRHQFTTGIQAMNLGAGPAQVNAAFAIWDSLISGASCGGYCQVTIAPGAAHTWYPPGIPALPVNQYGAAQLTADQPLAVIVNDLPLTGEVDAGIYSGISLDAP